MGILRFLEKISHTSREVYMILVILCALSIAILAFGIRHETNSRINAIQKSRIAITYEACIETNRRHHLMTDRLDNLIGKQIKRTITQFKKGAITNKQENDLIQRILSGKTSTIFLLDAVIPYTNCAVLLKNQFGKSTEIPQE